MIEAVLAECREQKGALEASQFILLEEGRYQHFDFLLVGWLLHELERNNKVCFLTFRQNYAHFLNLSKKIGKSIEGYFKEDKLTMIECFQAQYCSDLPLTQNSPSCYTTPPTKVRKLQTKNLTQSSDIFKEKAVVIVDSVSFLEETPQICLWIYQNCRKNNCKIIFGGCQEGSLLSKVLSNQADLIFRTEKDVSGYGKFQVALGKWKQNLLWKNNQGKIEFSQHVKL